MGATLIAASLIVLLLGVSWLNKGDPTAQNRMAAATADGVTLPTDRDGHTVDVPPSQPATPVSFGPDGEILRPDPVRARVVDDSGEDVLVPLAPNTTVDTVTGAIVPKTTTTTTSGTTGTTRPATTTTTTGGTTTTDPPAPTTTTTTEPPTTTTTTTEPPTTDPPTTPTTETTTP